MIAHTHSIQNRLFKSLALLIVCSLLLAPLALPTRAAGAAAPAQSYIVQAGSAAQAAQLVQSAGGTVTSSLDIVHGVAALLTPQAAARLQGLATLTPNATVDMVGSGGDNGDHDDREEGGFERVSPATDYSDGVGADYVWQEGGVTGKNVSVAILDTGLGRHRGVYRDLRGRLGRVVAWKDFISNRRAPFDPNGHGTHIAGIIANTQVGADQEWNGVAPGVDLVAVRVLDENGQGTYETVIRGLQWVMERKDQYNIRILNLSLVSPAQSAYWADPLNQAVTRAWAEGITVVAAAGNGGPGPMSIGVPGNNPYVITVGAFTDNYTPGDWNDDYITPFSAAGPTLDGFVKPDLVAPGAHMVSTMLPHTVVARTHQANRVANQYFEMAGTSQSAAVVSGVSALVLAAHPELSPNQVKFRLLVTAFPWIDPTTTEALYSMWQQGTGRVNAPDAVFAEIEGEANPGMDVWADVDGVSHYEGYSYYDDDAGAFRLRGGYDAWAGGYGTWSGGYGTWSGGYGTWSGGYGTWSGGYGTWSGGYGTWSGGYGTWSGGYGTWSGGYGTWSGGYGTWSGGYGTWSGGYGTWSGSEPWAGSIYSEAGFVEHYLSGRPIDSTTTTTSITEWVEE